MALILQASQCRSATLHHPALLRIDIAESYSGREDDLVVRESVKARRLHDELFATFTRFLRTQGLMAKRGAVINAHMDVGHQMQKSSKNYTATRLTLRSTPNTVHVGLRRRRI